MPTFTLRFQCARSSCNGWEEALHFFPQVRDRLAIAREMPQQASLEESIKQRIEGAPGDDRLSATKRGKAGPAAPHHIFQALVDLGDVVAKGLFKQRLRAKVVPEAMHPSLVANRLAELFQKTLHQFVAALRRRRDLVVPRDALRLVVTNTTADQVDLIAEIIVQHAVRKLGFLRDLAQAGPRIAELGQGFQRSLGKFDSSCTELVDTSTLDSIRGPTRPPRRFNLPPRHSRFLAHAQNSESPRHLGSNNAQKRPAKSSSTRVGQGLLDKCIDFGRSSRYSWPSVKFPSIAAGRSCRRGGRQAAHQRRPTGSFRSAESFFLSGREARPGGSLAARQAVARHKMKSQREEYAMSEKSLAGRRALVTGGARGIGAAIAEALTNAGASVMIGDILADLGKETAGRLAKTGAKTGFVELNVTDDAQWEKAVAATIAALGGYDILINNAGIEITSLVVDLKAEDLRLMSYV